MTNIRPDRSHYARRFFLIAFLMAIIAVSLLFAVRPIAAQQHGGRSNDCTATPDNGITEFSSTNADAVQDAIDAAADGAVVKVAGTCVGVQPFVLSNATINATAYISKALTLQGGYAFPNWGDAPDGVANPTVLDGDDLGRVIVIHSDDDTGPFDVNVSHLTIQHGNGEADGELPEFIERAGGIYIQENTTVTIAHSSVINNSAGVGGGIFTLGNTTILTSAVAYNTAANSGGGIVTFDVARVTIRDSAIVGNQAAISGGVRNLSSNPTLIENTTFSGNSANAFGSALRSGDSMQLINVTMSDNLETGNTGTLFVNAGDTITIINSIISNSSQKACSLNSDGTLTVFNSVIDDNSCEIIDGVNGNIIADPQLSPLQDNGGPTPTYALLIGSPAIDAADNAFCPAADQRGEDRPGAFTDICDAGAFELQSAANFCIATPDNGITEFTSLNADAVQDAIDAATDGAVVKVAGRCVGVQPVVLSNTTLNATVFISKALTLQGGYAFPNWDDEPDGVANPTFLDGDNLGRVIVIHSNVDTDGFEVNVSHLTIQHGNGKADGELPEFIERGGGIYIQQNKTVTIADSSVISSSAGVGAGIFTLGNITILTSSVAYNTAAPSGGGIVTLDAARLTIRNSAIVGNRATRVGGIRNLSSNPMLIENSTFSANSAGELGSALFSGVSATLINVTVSDNVETSNTGALAINSDSTLTLTNSIIANSSRRACSLSASGTLTVFNSVIDDNTCDIADGVNGNIIANPQLGPLQDNGGTTLTHALLVGSPAIGSADNAQCPAKDQRGFARDAACDMGAFEFEGVPTAVGLRGMGVDRPMLSFVVAMAITLLLASAVIFVRRKPN